jgi:hypothetical protein
MAEDRQEKQGVHIDHDNCLIDVKHLGNWATFDCGQLEAK